MKKICTVVCFCSILTSACSSFSFRKPGTLNKARLTVFGKSVSLEERNVKGKPVVDPLDFSFLSSSSRNTNPAPPSPLTRTKRDMSFNLVVFVGAAGSF